MTELSKYKRDQRSWYSPPFYSGPEGYKLCLCVNVEPQFVPMVGDTILIHARVYLMRGEYDDRLVWPFRGDITVQLVNQISYHKHLEETFGFASRSRVTSGERAKSGCEQRVFSLDYFAQYIIKNDCVKFRVINVSVAS